MVVRDLLSIVFFWVGSFPFKPQEGLTHDMFIYTCISIRPTRLDRRFGGRGGRGRISLDLT